MVFRFIIFCNLQEITSFTNISTNGIFAQRLLAFSTRHPATSQSIMNSSLSHEVALLHGFRQQFFSLIKYLIILSLL